MASPSSVAGWNPKKILVAGLLATAFTYAIGIASVLLIADIEKSQLVKYELSVLLRAHGDELIAKKFRELTQTAFFRNDPGRIQISDSETSINFSFSSEGLNKSVACSREDYFAYQVEFCRNKQVPWQLILLLTSLYASILLVALAGLNRSGATLLNSFRQFFAAAHLPHPEPMTFSSAWVFANGMAEQFRFLQLQAKEIGRAQAAEQIASQLAHDIRSPLTALNMVAKSLEEIPEEKRQLLSSISQRINDIANCLLYERKIGLEKTYQLEETKQVEKVELGNLVSQIVEEKRSELIASSGILLNLENDSQRFSNVVSADLSRAISNLLNNAVEAVDPFVGKVTITLQTNNGSHRISICDNGKGMPPVILSKYGREPFTFGKDVKYGNGIGVMQAKKALQQSGGNLLVDSEEGCGTTVSLILPTA